MKNPIFIDAVDLERALSVEEAIGALCDAFKSGLPAAAPRSHIEVPDGELLVMPAPGVGDTGVKIVTICPRNPSRGLPRIHGLFALFSPDTLAVEAIMDGGALTAMRTAAVSALATRLLANEEARRLVIFGAGRQGQAHLRAIHAVRPLRWVGVVDRHRDRVEALLAAAKGLGIVARHVGREAVANADIICTCTSSATPVMDGGLVAPGTHVNAIGAYRPTSRELDGTLIARGRVVVETREAALADSGDLAIPISTGELSPDHIVADLAEMVAGRAVRTGPGDITIFKSVGVAVEDLVIARAAWRQMRHAGSTAEAKHPRVEEAGQH